MARLAVHGFPGNVRELRNLRHKSHRPTMLEVDVGPAITHSKASTALALA
jgi:hypothetical protein